MSERSTTKFEVQMCATHALASLAWVAIFLLLAVASRDVLWVCMAFSFAAGVQLCFALPRLERWIEASSKWRVGR